MATILVVDDSRGHVELMITVFTGEGHEVLRAYNGQTGLEVIRARNGQVDVLISDAHMKEMGGVELIQTVKREFSHIKTVLYSISYEVASLAKEAGADRYIMRGEMQIEDVIKLVNELLAEKYLAGGPTVKECLDQGLRAGIFEISE